MKYLTVESFVNSLPEEEIWKIIEDYETYGADFEAQFLREKAREYCDKYYYMEHMPFIAMGAYRHFALKYKENANIRKDFTEKKEKNSKMNFSDLPNDSWEKVMLHVVDIIGGESGGLTEWNDTVPTPYGTGFEILSMFEYIDDLKSGTLTEGFRKRHER